MDTKITPILAERVWDVVHGTITGVPTDVSTAAKRLGISKAQVFATMSAHRPVYVARENVSMRMAALGLDTETRSLPVTYLYRGRHQSVSAWCADMGVPVRTVQSRLARGYSFAESIKPFKVDVDAEGN